MVADWIPVSKELPDSYELVVVIDDHACIFIALLDFDGAWRDADINVEHYELENIVAWLPIPEYKKEWEK